jgi:3-deoxy-7-phosphoheptulonate synthase
MGDSGWSPSSWASKPVKQDVEYKDKSKLSAVLDHIKYLPPLVHPGEVH